MDSNDFLNDKTEELTENTIQDEEVVNENTKIDSECEDLCDECGESCAGINGCKTKFSVQKPIIISTIAFLLVAVIVCSLTIINGFISGEPKTSFGFADSIGKEGKTTVTGDIVGAWVLKEAKDSGEYMVFDKYGNVFIDGGGMRYFGTYTLTKTDDKEVISSDFYIFGAYGSEATVTYSDDKKEATIDFTSTGYSLSIIKSKLPDRLVDAEKITHASADEAGLSELSVDNNVVGKWAEDMYGAFTFNSDGTGYYRKEYGYDIYLGVSYGAEEFFKYTTKDGVIYATMDYYNGEKLYDFEITYSRDKENNTLVLDGVGYKAAK